MAEVKPEVIEVIPCGETNIEILFSIPDILILHEKHLKINNGR